MEFHSNVTRCVDTVISALDSIGRETEALAASAADGEEGIVIIGGKEWGFWVCKDGLKDPMDEHSSTLLFHENMTPEQAASIIVAHLLTDTPCEWPKCPACEQED